MKPSKGTNLFNGTGYRRRVSGIVGACEWSQYLSREDEDGHSEETYMGDKYPTECLVSTSCKEGTERRG